MEHGYQDEEPPPPRLFERLAQVPGYTWDQTFTPFHSSYGHWHVFGLRHNRDFDSNHTATPSVTTASSGRSDSARNSPKLDPRPSFRHHWSSVSDASAGSEISSSRSDPEALWTPVVGRVSVHMLRLEREITYNKHIQKLADPECRHVIRPIELFRLPTGPEDGSPMLVSIVEAPGMNYLREWVNFGSAFYGLKTRKNSSDGAPAEQIPLQAFLDFAVGACECLELVHYGAKAVHGEIRPDAFHWNRETNQVKIVNAGNGSRSFENLLSSEGWATLSTERGVRTKLAYVAPEQTGRLSAEPDSRTDIYTLGVMFWSLLTGRQAFDAESPIDIVQKVLSSRLPAVSSVRMDVPDAISHVITKMTQKQMDERYHSISGLKYDLVQISKFLGEGDRDKMNEFKVGKKDVSAFFILPSKTFGRHAENEQIFKIIDKVHKRQQSASSKAHAHALYSNASNSSFSDTAANTLEVADVSDTSSSTGIKESRSNSTTIGLEPSASGSKLSLMSMFGRNIAEKRYGSSWDSSDRESQLSSNLHNLASDSFSKKRDTQKLRRRGKCEVITLLGSQGVGKTHLIKSVQPSIRRSGYFALARFDRAKPILFEPLIKVMASLFRQIFSERDVTTPYHELIRSQVRSIWGVLHTVLNLPESLLEAALPSKKLILGNQSSNRSVQTEVPGVDPGSSTGSSMTSAIRDSQDFLRGPASTKSIRFINAYLDTLRVMCTGRVICLCLDDLHAADEESIDLITHVIKAKIPAVLILSSRYEDGQLPAGTKKILDLESANRIELSNLRRKDVFEYVAATLSQDLQLVIPLAAVVHEKSAGNPFLIKEILQTCYQKNCLWYDWRVSGWQYNLDRVSNELASGKDGCLTTQFITDKMQSLQVAARSILAWASLIGNAFSFSLVQKLLTGDHTYRSDGDNSHDITCSKRLKISESDCIDGLQTLLNYYILIPGESDDEFRFSHAQYLRAANSMRECRNTVKMHYLIAETMMGYLSQCKFNLYPLARHICLAADIIKQRAVLRAQYRDVLWRGAKRAAESGAQPTALWYYKVCIDLLQDDRWNPSDDIPDVSMDETLQLYVQTAELHVMSEEYEEAMELLTETFVNVPADRPADKVRSWILWGRIYTKQGNFKGAFNALTCSLGELGLPLIPITTEECDLNFKKLEYKIRSLDRAALLERPMSEDKITIALGTIISEALSSSYWSDNELWYQLSVEYVNILIDRGNFVQAGISFTSLAMIALARFKDVELAILLSEYAQEYLTMYDDAWTRGRGWMLYCLFVGHLQTSMRNLLPVLESSLEYALSSQDRVLCLMNLGALSFCRFWSGQDLSEVEAFCSYGPDEFDGWESDVRGGNMIIAARQLVRALRGKTDVHQVKTVLDDESHQHDEYLLELTKRSPGTTRSRDLYEAMTYPVYYHFGYYQRSVDLGRRLVSTHLDQLWTSRPVATVRYYLALSLCAIARELPREERSELIEEARRLKSFIDVWGSLQDVNYGAWSNILAGEIADVTFEFDRAVCSWEMAIDHSQVHGFTLEEALAVELQAEFLLRRGGKRAGKVMIQEAVAAWNRINAVGKAIQLSEKHEWLIKTATGAHTMNVGTQTTDITSFVATEDTHLQNKQDYTKSWVTPAISAQAGTSTSEVPGLGLDILDLTSILEFSRVISSELHINALLSKMTSVILECVGGQAEFCAIIIDSEDQGWCVAASGDHENGVKTYPDGISFAEVDDQVAQQITHYLLRTKETIFIQNVLEDERFANVSEAYLTRNPNGRAVIAIPVVQAEHLMGVIHLEGRPNAFTQRNMVVLNLLTNQVSISLGNAFLYRKVRKVSASNATMVESQKRALAHARDAEAKAKKAEAEAMHSVKLKEEAAKAKSIFLANVSHELRTPLNGVIGMSELLKGTPLSKDQEGYADSIRVCADTLLTVINDILDFSKLEAGKMQMFTVPVNLKETITEVVRALAYTNQEHGLQTIEDLELDDSLVLGDPVRLHQIFMNLLSNSYKFTPKGSVTVKARKILDADDKIKVTCAVADTGIGITAEQLSRLFQPFSQADSSTARSYGGSGLGLSICKAMIENVLGGKIWIESAPGVGTTVFFTLSFQKAPKDSSVPSDMKISAKDPDPMQNWSQSHAGEPIKASFCDLSKVPREELRVCIAEDNAINRKVATSFVGKLGLKCEAFEDGKLAYEALQRRSKEGQPFHIVLMDVQMPVLDGYEATKAIRKDEDPHVREVLIIALTASAIRGDRDKCLSIGMDNYLAKPVRQQSLKTMLDEYLNKPKQAVAGDVQERQLHVNGNESDGAASDITPTPSPRPSNSAATLGPAPGPNGAADTPSPPLNDVAAAPVKKKRPVIVSRTKRKESNEPSTALDQSTNRGASLKPSGIQETEETGRISSEDVNPKSVDRQLLAPSKMSEVSNTVSGESENVMRSADGS